MTHGWCAWIQSRRKTDAIEGGGLHLCVSDVYADCTKPGYITERERAVARCCADPGEHDRTSRGRRASSTYNHLIRFEGKPGGGGSPSGETPASLRSVYKLPS